MITARGPQTTMFRQARHSVGGLGTRAATGNPDTQGQAAGLGTAYVSDYLLVS